MIKKLVEISSAELNDILNIWLVTSLNCHSFISESYWRSQSKRDSLKEELMASEISIYLIDNKIVGFIALNNTYIPALYVLDAYQQQGVGTELLKSLKETSNRLVLSTYQKNKQATEFYLKHGFSVIDENIGKANNEIEFDLEWTR